MGYDVFVSLDLDEYLFPTTNDRTAMDEMMEWFVSTKRRLMLLPKLNFNPVPHFLEPLNLLTVEAFLTRMRDQNRMNYYKTISPKVGLWLSDRNHSTPDFSNLRIDYMIHCCDFHGCGNYHQHRACGDSLKDERWRLEGKHLKWKAGLHLHHYARSLEKFMLKQKTWETAGGESSKGYDFYHFLDRTAGFTYDDTALSWTCQLRELLSNRTGEKHYLRAGDFWYRNPEFGRVVSDASKRGRNGAGYGKYLAPHEMNPYPPGETYQAAHRPYDPKKHKMTS